MNYETFCNLLQKKLPPDFPENTFFQFKKIRKNNGITSDALIISAPGDTCTPVFYLKDYYCRYKEGLSLEEICRQIEQIYVRETAASIISPSDFNDFSKIQSRVVYRLINTQTNQDLLNQIPHRTYLDFSIVYYLLINIEENTVGSAYISYRHIENWSVTEAQLYELASVNTPVLMPHAFIPMDEMLRKLSGDSDSDLFQAPQEIAFPMYILSNAKGLYGSSAILYPDLLKNLYKQFHAFYLLPSSLHEMLLIPAAPEIEASYLLETVADVNATVLEQEDYLSNNVYYYTEEEGLILIPAADPYP